MSNSSGTECDPRSWKRRMIMLGVGSGIALSTFGILPRPSPSPAAPASQDNALNTFMALSALLTAKKQLDADLGRRFFDALSKENNRFPQDMQSLYAFLQSRTELPLNQLLPTLEKEQANLSPLPALIVSAWYLGQVGPKPHQQVIAYERALMFVPVQDVLTIPSYCRDVPGYWAKQP